MTFLTAQRVVSPAGATGVNAFRRSASAPPAEDAVVEAEYIEVSPGGNAVRSYLDIEAPSELSPEDIVRVVNEVAGSPQQLRLPISLERLGLHIHFGCEQSLETSWREELCDLARYLTRPLST